jgi:hypothetical protein
MPVCRPIRIITKGLGLWAATETPQEREPLSLTDAVGLVERVQAAAAQGARESLEALAATTPAPIARVAIRACPELPPTIEKRIADNRAQTVADSVMYREAPATAAEARGGLLVRPRARLSRRRGRTRLREHPDASRLSCTRWVDRSDHPGRPNTSSPQPQRSRPRGTRRPNPFAANVHFSSLPAYYLAGGSR